MGYFFLKTTSCLQVSKPPAAKGPCLVLVFCFFSFSFLVPLFTMLSMVQPELKSVLFLSFILFFFLLCRKLFLAWQALGRSFPGQHKLIEGLDCQAEPPLPSPSSRGLWKFLRSLVWSELCSVLAILWRRDHWGRAWKSGPAPQTVYEDTCGVQLKRRF